VSSEELIELCRSSKALLEGHFLLSSGRHSDRYFQCALLLCLPSRAEMLARLLAGQVRAAGLEIDCVVGPALGAVTWAHEVARALSCRSFFTERNEGRMELRRGFCFSPKERVLVVEDVVTTGGSAREVIELVRAADARPLGVGAIFNRSATNPFAELNLPLFSLAELEVASFSPEQCPLCASGTAGPAVKPGSRSVASGRAG
jgi:orotate phosphoribosyltransferase